MIISTSYAHQIQSKVIGNSGSFQGFAKKIGKEGEIDIYQVDGAVEVRDLNERVRKAALEQFQKGFFSYLSAGFGAFFLFCTFVVMPVTSLIGYRIANSHLAHAGVAFATFIIGLSCLTIGLGDNTKDLPEIRFFKQSKISEVQNARLLAKKNPLDFLLKNEKYFTFFHPCELLKLMNMAKNQLTASAHADRGKDSALLKLNQLFKNDPLTNYLASDHNLAQKWQKVLSDWESLDIQKTLDEADQKMKKQDRELNAAKNITRAPGNMFTGVGGMVEKDDPTGATIVKGMGTAFNFFVDQTINTEIEDDSKREKAKIEMAKVSAMAAKWDQAMKIFDRIAQLSGITG